MTRAADHQPRARMGRSIRRLTIAITAASIFATSMLFVATPRIARADYSGPCVGGTQGFYQWYWGWNYQGSTTGAIYGAYSDVYFGQHLQACSFASMLSSGATFVEGANLTSKTYGSNGVVQVALAQAAGYSTNFYYTVTDHGGGSSVPATWYPWAPVIGHSYRQFIWESLNVHDADTWEFCIAGANVGMCGNRAEL